MINCISRKAWDECTYLFPNFTGCTVEWARNFTLRYIMEVTLTMLGLNIIHVSKRGPTNHWNSATFLKYWLVQQSMDTAWISLVTSCDVIEHGPQWFKQRPVVWRHLTGITRTSGLHYSGVIMSTMASQITGVSTVCSFVCSGAGHWPLWGESTDDRWIPLTKDQ